MLFPSTFSKYADGSLAYDAVRFMSETGVRGAANMHSWTVSGLIPSWMMLKEAEAVVIFGRYFQNYTLRSEGGPQARKDDSSKSFKN